MTQLHETAPSNRPAFSSRPASPEPSTSSAQDPFPSLFPTRNAVSYASKSSKRTVLANPRTKTPSTLRNYFRKANTAVMTETVDLESLSYHDLDGSILSPTHLLDALNSPNIYYHLWVAVKMSLDDHDKGKMKAPSMNAAVLERLIVELGKPMIDRAPGPHITFVDPRFHGNANRILRNAIRLIDMFEESGVNRDSIVVTIPATEEGILASNYLERKCQILTNLNLVGTLAHAAACAQSGANLVSIAVGPLLDWYERKRKAEYQDIKTHPGIEHIQATAVYFKLHKHSTRLVGTNFRTLKELGPLGCLDAIVISKDSVEQSNGRPFPLVQSIPKTSPAYAHAEGIPKGTAFQGKKSEFISFLSNSDRSALAETMHVTLGRLKVKMQEIDKMIQKELSKQYTLRIPENKLSDNSSKDGSPQCSRSSVESPEKNLHTSENETETADKTKDTEKEDKAKEDGKLNLEPKGRQEPVGGVDGF
ncbi:uncharacterized protein ARMOST_14124 [Armillaria ostoyae]|uniref:Uncharacterized protein n=1 Tax=Armillaria ostoyae TaxID=47428 RepID=A0A284RPQ5_ARMOS|nr:uncharacterized protein ARMOST_14124 [Armillaria ostoyae]